MKRFATLLLTVGALGASPSWASEGVVLAVRPEGAVIDASPLPDLQPGSRVGFIRADGRRTPTGQGFVLDLREGRGLVGVAPGGSVREQDLVVQCPVPGRGPEAEARGLVDAMRAQIGSAGGPAQQQALANVTQLQTVLDAREAAIQQGTCDTASYDQQIQVLAGQLQTAVANPLPAAAGAPQTGYPPAGSPPGGYPPPGYPPSGSAPAGDPGTGQSGPSPTGAYPGAPPPDASAGLAPPAGAPGGPPSVGPAPGQTGDTVDTATRTVDLLAKLAQIAQGFGVSRQGGGRGAASLTAPQVPQGPGSGLAAGVDPAAGGYPPAGGASSVSGGYPPAGGASGGSYPPASGGYPPATGAPASQGGYPPASGGYPPAAGGYPPAGGGIPGGGTPPASSIPPVTGGIPPATGGTPPAGGSTIVGGPKGTVPWYQIAKPLPVSPAVASGSITSPGSTGANSSVPGKGVVRLVPRAALANGSVTGHVRTPAGQPITTARIAVGASYVQTDALGAFAIPNLTPGPYTMTITAPGYQSVTRSITLDPGEVEQVNVAMQKLGLAPARPLPLVPQVHTR